MTNKRVRLPKEALLNRETHPGPGESFLDTSKDVEGHAWTNPAPPIDFSKQGPGHGGEHIPETEDDTDPLGA